jgi:parallel beta-helix repeat protein
MTKFSIFFLILLLTFSKGYAQPSGGPYGPSRLKYSIPKTGKIFYVSPEGKVESKGDILYDPTTIEEAIKRANTGDAVILRGGVYRTGNLTFNQGIIIQPYADEQPVLKGTFEAKSWKDEGNGLWSTTWEYLFPATYESWWHKSREEKFTPLHRFNNDMVFIDGEFLQSAGSKEELNEKTFYVDYNTKTIYIKQEPNNHYIEITAFRKCIFRTTALYNGKKSDGIGPKIYGLEITQYPDTTVHIDGFYPQGISAEKDHGNDVTGTTIENCDISNCFRIGLFTIGDKLTLKNCKISNTSTEGLYIVASDDVLLEKNIFTSNNVENITGYYPSAVKIFNQCYRVKCVDNLIIDLPNSNGLWYDVGNVDGIFINNWAENVGSTDSKDKWPMNGFFFEISKNAKCANNVFVNCGNGIMVLNSCNVHVYQNTLINSSVGFNRDGRSAVGDHFGWHPATGPDVKERIGHVFVNNILYANKDYKKPLMSLWQPAALCDSVKDSPLKQMDYNVYIKDYKNNFGQIMLWSPAKEKNCQQIIESLEDMQKLFAGSSVNSKIIIDKNLAVFKSKELGNYQLSNNFGKNIKALKLPLDIQKLLKLSANYTPYVGAYQPK